MLSYDKSGITQGLVCLYRFLLHAFVQYVFGRYCSKIQIWVPSQTIYLFMSSTFPYANEYSTASSKKIAGNIYHNITFERTMI